MRLYNVEVLASRVVDLRSDSPGKFSCHLIWDLPDAVFADNGQVGTGVVLRDWIVTRARSGNFVLGMLARFGEQLKAGSASEAVRSLVVQDSVGASRTLFVDGAVYSRNRSMRCLGSCKHGKTAALRPAGESADRPLSQALFRRSLMTFHADTDPRRVQLLTAPNVRPTRWGPGFDEGGSEQMPDGVAADALQAFVLSLVAATGHGAGRVRSVRQSQDGD